MTVTGVSSAWDTPLALLLASSHQRPVVWSKALKSQYLYKKAPLPQLSPRQELAAQMETWDRLSWPRLPHSSRICHWIEASKEIPASLSWCLNHDFVRLPRAVFYEKSSDNLICSIPQRDFFHLPNTHIFGTFTANFEEPLMGFFPPSPLGC